MSSATAADVQSAKLPDDPSASKSDPEAGHVAAKNDIKDETEEAEDSVAPVGYWKMFRYATGRQWTLTIVGLALSWFNGAALPAFALLFGKAQACISSIMLDHILLVSGDSIPSIGSTACTVGYLNLSISATCGSLQATWLTV